MTIRTRVAVTVILLLIGWVFAAPHYRLTASNPTAGSASSPPTLQIQRAPLVSQAEVTDVEEDFSAPLSPQDRGVQAANRSRFSAGTGLESFPALDLPPPIVPTGTNPDLTPVGSSGAEQTSLKPVSLIGTDIGSDATWTAHPNSKSRSPEPATTLRQNHEGIRLQSTRESLTSPPIADDRGLQAVSRNPPPAQLQPRWHRIVDGDTLKGLSMTYYGIPNLDLLIFAANRHTLISPGILPIGVELAIPDKPVAQPRQRKENVRPMYPIPISSRNGADSEWRSAKDYR